MQVPLAVRTAIAIVVAITAVWRGPDPCQRSDKSHINDPEEEHPSMQAQGQVQVEDLRQEKKRGKYISTYSKGADGDHQ